MIYGKILWLHLALLTSLALRAQDMVPKVTGTASISVKKGTVACDFMVTNLSRFKKYDIRLNAGMNIIAFRDFKHGKMPLDYDVDFYDSVETDEARAYYLHENRGNPAKYYPDTFEVKYVGMYPIADSAHGFMGQDWRGNAAFNGYSARIDGYQSAWYPVIFDMNTRRPHPEVMYDITLKCEDCSVLFVNGNSPKHGTQAQFKNDYPCEMAVYCGNFATAESHGLWLLNSNMRKEDEQRVFDIATRDQDFYVKLFHIPYKGTLTFVQTTPVADPTEWAFAFWAAPTTFNVGVGQWGLKSLFNPANAIRNKQTMAHELAHYYFGTLLKTQGVMGAVIAEGFAEYLSYQLIRALEGDSAYKGLLDHKIQSLNGFQGYQPFSLLKTEKDYGNREYYLYYYAPVLFMAIKKEIGDEAMENWLRAMVNSHAEITDYFFLVSTLESSVPDKDLVGKVESKYFTSPDALANAIEELK